MGRSVSTPTAALLVAFNDWPDPPEDAEDDWYPDHMDFEMFVEDITECAREMWPSLEPCDKFIGREDRAVLENSLVYFGVSEYCGLASIWIAEKTPNDPLAQGWCDRIKKRFYERFSTLRKLGHMSNGEGVYERVQRS